MACCRQSHRLPSHHMPHGRLQARPTGLPDFAAMNHGMARCRQGPLASPSSWPPPGTLQARPTCHPAFAATTWRVAGQEARPTAPHFIAATNRVLVLQVMPTTKQRGVTRVAHLTLATYSTICTSGGCQHPQIWLLHIETLQRNARKAHCPPPTSIATALAYMQAAGKAHCPPSILIATTLAYMQARPPRPWLRGHHMAHCRQDPLPPSRLQSPPLWHICKQDPLPPRLCGHHMAKCMQDPLPPRLQSPPLWRTCRQGPLPPRLHGHHLAFGR